MMLGPDTFSSYGTARFRQHDRRDVGVPTIGDHCDVHVRVAYSTDGGRDVVAFVSIYDRQRARWYVGAEAGTAALCAALTYAGVSQRARAAAVPL